MRRQEAGSLTVVASLLLTTLAVAAVARAPVFMPKPELRRAVDVQQQHNLLTSTLAPLEVAAPFVPLDWRVPPTRAVQQPEVPQNLLALGIPVPVVPFVQSDWPVPKAAAGLKPQLHGRGPSLDPTKPHLQSDWPNPVLPRIPKHEPGFSTLALYVPVPPVAKEVGQPIARQPAQQDVGRSALALTEVQATVQAPFVQTDWPKPLGRAVQQPGEGTNFLSRFVQYAAQDQQWPNPRLRRWQEQPEGYVNRLPLTVVVAPPETLPFSQTDWQRPWGAKYPAPTMHFRGQEFDPTKPFAQNDWQNPRARNVLQRDDTVANLLLGYPEPPAVESPFFPAQLPDPLTRRAAQQPGETTNFLSRFVQYAPQDSLWPNPVRARQVQQPWVTQNPLLLGIPDPPVVTPVVFGNATAMPVTLRPAALQPIHARGESFDATKPFHQDDWNVRYSLRWCQSIHDQQLNILLLGIPDPPVVAQDSEWIIRARRRGRR